MKRELPSVTRLELRLARAPMNIIVQGEKIQLRGRQDAGILVLVSSVGPTIVSEEIVAVSTDVPQMLSLIAFVRADGGITLHPDLR